MSDTAPLLSRPHPAKRAFSGAPWESKVGYCRALRRGDHIWVSGCAPMRADGTVFAPRDPERQAERCIAIAADAIGQLGGEISDVVRTRIYLTDTTLWPQIGAAHAATFGDHPPVCTLVAVAGLIDPGILVEMEFDAFVG